MKDFLLTVAGFDPTGGAGILRDWATFRYFSFLGCGVITANTAQNTKGVKALDFVRGELIKEQLELILEEIPVKGVKIGLPHRGWVNRVIAEKVGSLGVPVVFDPVLAPTYGKEFVKDLTEIAPLIEVATVITPNYSEFKRLKPIFGGLFKEKIVVVKGAPKSSEEVEDLLIIKGEVVSRISHKRDGRVVRGTGCAFSSAYLALLAGGLGTEEAFKRVVEFVSFYREKAFKLAGALQLYPSL